MKIPRKNSLVKCIDETICSLIKIKKEQSLVFLGEIQNMPGHCIIVLPSGKIIWGYHTDDFIELTEEEV